MIIELRTDEFYYTSHHRYIERDVLKLSAFNMHSYTKTRLSMSLHVTRVANGKIIFFTAPYLEHDYYFQDGEHFNTIVTKDLRLIRKDNK